MSPWKIVSFNKNLGEQKPKIIIFYDGFNEVFFKCLKENNYYSSARENYIKTIDFLNKHLIKDPLDERAYATLGLTYARLGRKDKSLEAIEKLDELLPISKDALFGTMHAKQKGRAFAILGDIENALETIEYLSALSGGYHYGELLNDPYFDSIRDHPRFQSVLGNLKPQS